MIETAAMWHEAVSDYGDTPNVVRLELPRDGHNEGAAWIYIPHKDTIYIGPQGSYHIDISHSLKNLVDLKKGEKAVTGVQYEDGYTDYFDATDKKTTDRILGALQMWHNENYGHDFNKAEDDAGAWDDSSGYYVYPEDSDYEDPDDDERSSGGLDTADNLNSYVPTWERSLKNEPDEYKQLKPSPGAPKMIHDWDTQDYLDWRDKKYWQSRGFAGTPREDFPHFRWSYGDSQIMKNPTHEGLWVWPTQNGYPDHFSQTGHNGLGNCAQGRIYPHQGDRWEILTWPGRPRNAPSQQIRDYIQSEAQAAVKQYVMDKIGVPEDKIFFTNMHYSAAVSFYDSPSYPDEDKNYYSVPKAKELPSHYEWEPLADWNSIPEGTFNRIKDPQGDEWTKSTLKPDTEGHIRLYHVGGGPYKPSIEIDPNSPTTGWMFGKKVYDEEKSTENPYDWKPGDDAHQFDQQAWGPNKSIQDTYDRYQKEKATRDAIQPGQQALPLGKPGDKQSGPTPKVLAAMHKNPDGSVSKISDLQAGPALFTWNGEWSVQRLTPEEAYEVKVRWFEEDQQRRRDIAKKMFPEAYGDAGDELDENGELKPPVEHDPMSQLESFTDPQSGSVIHVPASDYELAYKLHGDDWWKSFIPKRDVTSSWQEVKDSMWEQVI